MNAPAYVAEVLALRASHPHAPALDVLDLVLQRRPVGQLDPAAPWLSPRSPFGAVLAEAFDGAMTPAQWRAWTGPDADPKMRKTLLTVWATEVLGAFAAGKPTERPAGRRFRFLM